MSPLLCLNTGSFKWAKFWYFLGVLDLSHPPTFHTLIQASESTHLDDWFLYSTAAFFPPNIELLLFSMSILSLQIHLSDAISEQEPYLYFYKKNIGFLFLGLFFNKRGKISHFKTL